MPDVDLDSEACFVVALEFWNGPNAVVFIDAGPIPKSVLDALLDEIVGILRSTKGSGLARGGHARYIGLRHSTRESDWSSALSSMRWRTIT